MRRTLAIKSENHADASPASKATDPSVWAGMIIGAVLAERDPEVLVRLATAAGVDLDKLQQRVDAVCEFVHTHVAGPSDRLDILRADRHIRQRHYTAPETPNRR